MLLKLIIINLVLLAINFVLLLFLFIFSLSIIYKTEIPEDLTWPVGAIYRTYCRILYRKDKNQNL